MDQSTYAAISGFIQWHDYKINKSQRCDSYRLRENLSKVKVEMLIMLNEWLQYSNCNVSNAHNSKNI